MKIVIDNTDYSGCLDAVRALEIVRKLNEPSVCRFWLSLPTDGSVASPLRNQFVVVSGDDGTLYFLSLIHI